MRYVKGADKLQKKLASLMTKESKAALRKGTRAGCRIIQARAKEIAPVKTGALKRGIKVRALPRSKKWVGTQVTLADTGEVYYGAFLELGTKRIPAKHFMLNAANDTKAVAAKLALQVAKTEIEARMK
jgi:HK97 gp10 family phage protein